MVLVGPEKVDFSPSSTPLIIILIINGKIRPRKNLMSTNKITEARKKGRGWGSKMLLLTTFLLVFGNVSSPTTPSSFPRKKQKERA